MSATAQVCRTKKTSGLWGVLSLYQVAATTVFMSILAVAVLPRFDADVWWQLLTGRHILTSGLPNRDFLSFTALGQSWINHEWLTQMAMWGTYQLGGLKLVLTLFGLITTGAFALVFMVMRLRGASQLVALVFTAIAAAATVGSWGAGAQTLTLLLAAGFCFALERYKATSGTEWLVGMVVLMWAWSNLNGDFVIGLLLMAAYLLGGLLDRMHGAMTVRQAYQRQRPLLVALVVGILVTLLTPDGFSQLLYPLRLLVPNAFSAVITEAHSPNFHLVQMLPFEALLMALLLCGLLVKRRVSWIDILTCGLFTILALQEQRNIAVWCVVVSPILAVYAQEVGTPLMEKWHHLNRPAETRFFIMFNWLLLAVVITAGTAFMINADSPSRVWAAEKDAFPAGAAAYVGSHNMTGNLFNSYGYGAYLAWKTDGRYPVFIDSRADSVYTGQTLSNYLSIYDASPGWQGLLQKYHIGWILVEPQAPIAAVLSHIDGWRTVFVGRLATIIEYKGGGHEQIH